MSGQRKIELLSENATSIVDGYWFWADQFLMIYGIPGSEAWLANQFTGIRSYVPYYPNGIYFSNKEYRNKMVEFYDCPFLEMQKLKYHNKSDVFGTDIAEFIVNSLSEGYFAMLMVERSCLSAYNINKSSFHQILIHGCDESEQVFHFCDNDTTGKFNRNLKCSFSELREGIKHFTTCAEEPDFTDTIFLFKPQENASYHINKTQIYNGISSYLHPDNQDCSEWINGIDVYKKLIQYYEEIISSNISHNLFDIRGLYALYDHKKAMLYRMKCFKDDCLQPIVNQYKQVLLASQEILNLQLKYNINENREILIKIKDKLSFVYTSDIDLLCKFLDYLLTK